MKLFSWLTVVILLNVIFAWATNQPQYVGENVPSGKLKSLSYAPFREEHDPFQDTFPSAKQIDEDLELLGNVTHNIRTYASVGGEVMELIPDLAKKHGLTVLQGAWLGGEEVDEPIKSAKLKAQNELEIATLIRSANEHPDVVKQVLVGNEVLLRGDLNVDELIAYIRQVKAAVKQPVSYADVWSEYMKHPQLISEVDFITIHILPYWEDEPIAVEDAPAHVERIYKQVQQKARSMGEDKPILIGESGWPSGGKQRGVAIPSVVNEAKFIRDFIKIANKNGFDYNIVEAFNQPWKAALEGIIGAKWGLYDSSRQQVFPLTGNVFENPNWIKNLAASISLLLAVIVYLRKEITELNAVRLISFLVISQIATVLFVSQLTTLWQTSYTDFQRLQTILIVGFNGAWGYFLLQRVIEILTKQTVSKTAKPLYYGLLIIITYAMIKTALLAWDGRYISFPNIVTQLQVFGLISLFAINLFSEKMPFSDRIHLTTLFDYIPRKPSHIPLVAYFLIGLSVTLIAGESYAFMLGRDFVMAHPIMSERLQTAILFSVINSQLLIWIASLGVLATPFFVSANTRKGGNSGTITP